MTRTKTFLLLMAILLAIFATLCVKIATGEEELMFSDADVKEINISLWYDHLIDQVKVKHITEHYEWPGDQTDYSKTVRMSATVE